MPGGRSISARVTCRKLSGLPAASARASSVLTTSYGTDETAAALSRAGRTARNALNRAIRLYYLLRVEGGNRVRLRARRVRRKRRRQAGQHVIARRGERRELAGGNRFARRLTRMGGDGIHERAALLDPIVEVRARRRTSHADASDQLP